MTEQNTAGLADEQGAMCPDCGHAERLHYALGHDGCHDLRCSCVRVVIPLRSQPTDPAARVVDRDGDVWALHEGRWGCLTEPSTPQAWIDLWHVCGPLTLYRPAGGDSDA